MPFHLFENLIHIRYVFDNSLVIHVKGAEDTNNLSKVQRRRAVLQKPDLKSAKLKVVFEKDLAKFPAPDSICQFCYPEKHVVPPLIFKTPFES